jgi:hypothetical protein
MTITADDESSEKKKTRKRKAEPSIDVRRKSTRTSNNSSELKILSKSSCRPLISQEKKSSARSQQASAMKSATIRREKISARKSSVSTPAARKSSEAVKRAAVDKSKYDGKQTAATQTTGRRFVEGRIGVFLCWHKNPDKPSPEDFFTTLLYRSRTTKLTNFSEIFGTAIYAAENLDCWLRTDLSLPKWRRNPVYWDYNNVKYEYQFLGPSCCMFQTKGTKVSVRLISFE